jgi:cell filamentation protein
MKPFSRYDTSALEEAQFEPGSRGRVLKNFLGVKSKREMDKVEAREQLRALDELVGIYGPKHRFTSADICKIHRIWLGSIYPWAGRYRRVNLSKGQFPFATAEHIPRLMEDFEKSSLYKYTPCNFKETRKTIRAISVVHTELILIHPFRDGNGRVGRLLSFLMALQAKLPPLDFTEIKGKKKQEYFEAVQAGMDRNYGPMEKIFREVIDRTPQGHE